MNAALGKRGDPPYAPFLDEANVDFVSAGLGCFVFQPALAKMDIAAACKK